MRARELCIAAAVAAFAGGVAIAACSTAANPAGEGQECFQATDCAEGLICLPAACNNGKQVCVSHTAGNFNCVVTQIDAGNEAAAPPPEAGPPPEGAPPPPEGGGMDTGTPPMDTGTPPMDTGTPPMDTGTPPMDTGTPPMDTGAPPG